MFMVVGSYRKIDALNATNIELIMFNKMITSLQDDWKFLHLYDLTDHKTGNDVT